jgi:hypothetical protein
MTAFAEDAEQPWSRMAACEELPAGWLPYVEVDDLAASANKAEKLGAKVLKGRTRGPAGDFVVIRDPAGGALALWESPESAARRFVSAWPSSRSGSNSAGIQSSGLWLSGSPLRFRARSAAPRSRRRRAV